MNKIIALCLTLLLLGVTGYIFLDQGYIRFNYPGYTEYPVRGIDISHHQDAIDWPVLERAVLDFVFIKATEGGDHKDRNFKRNWQKAAEAGLARGAYHFFTFCKTGAEQAVNFIESVPQGENTLPPAIDLEFGGNCSARPAKEELHRELAEYARMVEERYGKRPIIYTTNHSYEMFFAGEDYDYPIWIRNIYQFPQLPDHKEWSFWQYANRGRIRGINGFVDLNVFNGTREEFNQLVSNER